MKDITCECLKCQNKSFKVMQYDDESSSGFCFISEPLWYGECNICNYKEDNIKENSFNNYAQNV